MALLNWLTAHWFDILQTAGIVGGLVFTGISLRTDTHVQRLQNLFTLTKQHREIWSILYSRNDLARILDAKADLTKSPSTLEERLFVKFLIFHLLDTYRAIQVGLFKTPEGLSEDIRDFFALPIPKDVWAALKPYQDRHFVAFIESHTVGTKS